MNMNVTPDIVKARRYAEMSHAGQLYDNELPYTVHLEFVVKVLERFGITDPVMACGAWLHDSIEDRGVSYGDIKRRFGFAVAELVFSVTNELGRNRAERNKKTYPKIREGGFMSVCLKLADRIANVEMGEANGGKNDMYAEEYPSFRGALYDAQMVEENPVLGRMWALLDGKLGK